MAWGSDTVGSIDTSSAAPGVDQAVITGTFRRQLSSRPVRPLPMEMAQIHDDTWSLGRWASRAAWNTMIKGPA
ncbi:hypothetical protein PBOI14_62370 [Pseudomonas sp. Boi14]|nr:hypothetical protein PBOI14_62370 [Pseudomonas sp. Boi14]